MTYLIIILTITIALFIWGKFTPDVVALLSMLSLFLVGILDLKEALSGFSNPTVIMIASLFIIGEGLSQTGWTALAGQKFIQWSRKNVPKLLVILTLGSGFLSGFVSNTGTVATLLPVTVSSAWNIGTMPSKLLMPVAFGSNTGGLLTLTGTPPNIIVSDALIERGYDGFSFFEFSLIGIPLLIVLILYFRFFGYKMLPSHKTKNRPINIESEMHKWIEAYKVDDNYFRLRVRSMSILIGTKIKDWDIEEKYDVSIIRIKRRFPSLLQIKTPAFIEFPDSDTAFKYHDIITVKGDSEAINKLMIKFRLGLQPLEPINEELKTNLINQEVGMAEVIVTPKSILVGRKIQLGDYLNKYNIQLLAASRNNQAIQNKNIKIKAGDAFLIRGTWNSIQSLKDMYENLVICGSPEGMSKNVDQLSTRSYIALGALTIMIFLLVFKIVPGAVAGLICAGIVLVSGCVPVSKAYQGISWTSVVMIAAMIPMGVAMQKTGMAQMTADALVSTLGAIHPVLLLSGIFLLTTGFSQTINNSATAVLMAPIAILAASTLGISPKPFMIAVAVSASTAFLTPMGTTTNAMVMAAGGYKFMDYFKVGFPLLLLFFIISMLLIPIIWPF